MQKPVHIKEGKSHSHSFQQDLLREVVGFRSETSLKFCHICEMVTSFESDEILKNTPGDKLETQILWKCQLCGCYKRDEEDYEL
jgi:hypothetical protein